VATFSDANLAAALSDFTATVNWGDGTIIAAQIVANSDGTFSVIASHTYKNAKTKSYSLAIQILDVGGSEANLTGTANLLP
jgi:large repetitive protein